MKRVKRRMRQRGKLGRKLERGRKGGWWWIVRRTRIRFLAVITVIRVGPEFWLSGGISW
jgi:hypothetical protein